MLLNVYIDIGNTQFVGSKINYNIPSAKCQALHIYTKLKLEKHFVHWNSIYS